MVHMNKIGEKDLTGLLSEFWNLNKKKPLICILYTINREDETRSLSDIRYALLTNCIQATSFEITFQSTKSKLKCYTNTLNYARFNYFHISITKVWIMSVLQL